MYLLTESQREQRARATDIAILWLSRPQAVLVENRPHGTLGLLAIAGNHAHAKGFQHRDEARDYIEDLP